MHTREAMETLVVGAIATACNCQASTITSTATASELGLDSLVLMAIAARVTASGGREWTEEELLQLFSAVRVSDIIDIASVVADARYESAHSAAL